MESYGFCLLREIRGKYRSKYQEKCKLADNAKQSNVDALKTTLTKPHWHSPQNNSVTNEEENLGLGRDLMKNRKL